MRTIKFRGKRIDNGEWVYGNLVMVYNAETSKNYPCIVISYNHDAFDWHEVIPETVSQFTGLHDKNGKEIYENDIVLMKNRSVRTGTTRRKVGRNYQSYSETKNVDICGVVKIGNGDFFYQSSIIAYIDTEIYNEFDSYFFGEGKRSDIPVKRKYKYSEVLQDNEFYEVIGNIYENPELLKL